MAGYTSFKELDCWKKCRSVKIWTHQFIRTLPRNEYDMKDNMRRAARSTSRNIAEGFGRFHFKENAQFCRISRGSLYELLDDLDSCLIEQLCKEDDIREGIDKINQAIYSLNGYLNLINKSLVHIPQKRRNH